MAHCVHPRIDEDLLPVLRDPQRLVQSVHVEAPSCRCTAAASAKPCPRDGSGGQRAAVRCLVCERDSLICIWVLKNIYLGVLTKLFLKNQIMSKTKKLIENRKK